MDQIVGVLKLLEAPGLILAALVIWLLFKALENRDMHLEASNKSLLELSKSYEKISALLETLVRK